MADHNHEHFNPAIPSTVGALLVEEVTMDPYSPLPSFLEMKMIEEATLSAQKALVTAMDTLVQRASHMSRTNRTGVISRVQAKLAEWVAAVAKHYGPEVRLLLTYMINRQWLYSASATVAESLYGTRRAKVVGPTRQLQPITDKDRTRLALLLSLSTYAKERLDQLYERLKRRRPTCNTRISKLQTLFATLYPYLHMTQEGTVLAYQFLYLVDNQAVYFHPLSHLLGLVVRRVTLTDAEQQTSRNSSLQHKNKRMPPEMIRSLRQAAVSGLSTVFILGWMTRVRRHLQHLQEQQNTIDGSINSSSRIPSPPDAPIKHVDPKQRIRTSGEGDSSLCALCQQPRIHPAAAPSGYVFCHRCLVMHVREHGTCPLTGIKCSEEQIVRLYEPAH